MIQFDEKKKLYSIIKLSVNNFIDERSIKIRLIFHTVRNLKMENSDGLKKRKKKKKSEGKKLDHSMEASKLGLVPRIPESQFSLGRNWARLVGLKARARRERACGGRRREGETCQVA